MTLQDTEVIDPKTGSSSTLYAVMDQSNELQFLSYSLREMAVVKGKDGYPVSPPPVGPAVNSLIDCLLNALVRGKDHQVWHLFDKACGLTDLSMALGAKASMEHDGVQIVAGADGLQGQQSRFIKSNEVPLRFMLNPAKVYKLCLQKSDLPPSEGELASCLSIPADSLIDMRACSFPGLPAIILSATGSFSLPGDLSLKSGQIAVLGVPVENVTPPAGYRLVVPIDSATFQRYYLSRRERPIDKKIEARAYVFSDPVNLTGIDVDLFTPKSSRYLLKRADPVQPLSTRWYDELIFACRYGRIPVTKLREFHCPYGMDLREYPLEMLPLPLKIPAPLKPLPNTVERLNYQRSHRREDAKLQWLQKGYHLINQQGWQILWRQGVRDFSAFIFDETHCVFSELIEELDLRDTHPQIMETLPAMSETKLPLGLEAYYCESLTRAYHAKKYERLAILTLGLSLLFFYICYCLRKRLISRLPETAQTEASQILAPFKKRPITRVASDYLNYKYRGLETVQSFTEAQKNLLFGALPEQDSSHYFDSMRYLPLFQTYRALRKFIKETCPGTQEQRDRYERELVNELEGMTPWLDAIKTMEELDEKNKRMESLLYGVIIKAMHSRQQWKTLSSRLLKPANSYFLGIFLAYCQPLKERIETEASGLFFNRGKDRYRFEEKFDILLSFQKKPTGAQLNNYYRLGHRVLCQLFRIIRKINRLNRKERNPERKWPSLFDEPGNLTLKEPEYTKRFN